MCLFNYDMCLFFSDCIFSYGNSITLKNDFQVAIPITFFGLKIHFLAFLYQMKVKYFL